MLKKIIIFSICFCLIISLSSCGTSQSSDSPDTADDKIKIVATIFPIYDWVNEIAGEYADVELLLSNGVDLHSYQPSVDDIISISDSDVFIYVGGASDSWVEDVISHSAKDDLVSISIFDLLGTRVKEEELMPGMQEEAEEHNDNTGTDYDEHVWLSLKNADIVCKEICSKLCSIDPKNSKQYQENFENYSARIKEMDNKFSSAIRSARYDTVLFGDRFPFRYLTDDYGIKYYAAFAGCSAESEASFETIIFLANKVDELSLPAIVKIETSDGSVAETIRNNTSSRDQKIIEMNSMQSCTKEDLENGISYLQIMDNNLAALLEALS